MPNHQWTLKDDLKILYIYKYGISNCCYSRNEIAEIIGVSVGSVGYRIANFKAIEGIGSATHFSILSEEVHGKYNNLPEPALKQLAFGSDKHD